MSNRIDVIYSSSSTSTPSIASAATALAVNSNRAAWIIQNLGTNPLYVLLGSGASTTVFNFIIPGGTVNDDGTGKVFTNAPGTVWTGIITVAGTSPRYVATELL